MTRRSSSSRRSRAHSVLEAPPSLRSLPGNIHLERLDNGLTVCLLTNRQAPVVTSALFYRAGTRDEPAGHGGVAHFLEHMMFKGSAHYGPGEIDRRTQALGGSNNAFTSHDLTAYYFNFAADRWAEALAIEVDRAAKPYDDFQKWCREIVWWGNKKGAYLYSPTAREITPELAGHY